MGFQHSLIVMGVLWGIGGAGFSLGWGPILRILSETLTTEQRKRTASLFPMNIPTGAAFTWAVIGLVVSVGGWRWGFWGPSIALIGVLMWWWFSNIDAPTAGRSVAAASRAYPMQNIDDLIEDETSTGTRFRWADMRQEIIGLAPVFVLSAFVGSVALGALTWMPTYVKDTELFSEELEGAAAGVLPLVGILGLLLASYLMTRLGRVLLSLTILLLMMAAALFLALIPVLVLQLLLMIVMTALSFGAMGLVLSTVPVTLASEGRASSAAGISTGVFSIAGGLASALAGVIVDEFSWEHVFVMWGVLMLVGGLVAWANLSRERPRQVG
jgi:OPA family sugar phosphate sensor protein UhpC-like MFS transporter